MSGTPTDADRERARAVCHDSLRTYGLSWEENITNALTEVRAEATEAAQEIDQLRLDHIHDLEAQIIEERQRCGACALARAERDAALAQCKRWEQAAAEEADRHEALLAQREAGVQYLRNLIGRIPAPAGGNYPLWSEMVNACSGKHKAAALAYATTLKAEGAREERQRLIPILCEYCAAGHRAFLVDGQSWTHEFTTKAGTSRGGCKAAAIRERG